MLSAEDIAAVKLAIALCNGPELKREIFCLSQAEGYSNARKPEEHYQNLKKKWDAKIENKTSAVLENLGLNICLKEKINGLVLLIGMKMLIWVKFNERIFGISRDFSIDFLNSSLFTSRGTIDNGKTAKEMIKCQRLNVKQKFKLASLYYFADEIPVLFSQMSKNDQEEFSDDHSTFNLFQSDLIKFWLRFANGKNDISKIEFENECLFDAALGTASMAAVQYYLEGTEINGNDNLIIDITHAVVKKQIHTYRIAAYTLVHEINVSNWSIFLPQSDFIKYHKWNPSDYCIDVLCKLFDKMSEDQKIKFLRKDLTSEIYGRNNHFFNFDYNGSLSYFLFWPYQSYFMKAMKLIWEFLPEWIFADLLVNICGKIETEVGALKYGESKTFNYKKLLREFWSDAPPRCKRYLFKIERNTEHSGKCCMEAFRKLFLLKDFTNEDRINVELILESATEEEKRAMIGSEVETLCINLIEKEKWWRFDILVTSLFASSELATKFKKEFVFKKRTQKVCFNFSKWAAVESFMKWTTFTEEELIQLKREMILSDEAKCSFKDWMLRKPSIKTANKFCECFTSSEDESREFRKNFILSKIGTKFLFKFSEKKKLNFVAEFISWCRFSAEEITKFKESFVSRPDTEVNFEDKITSNYTNTNHLLSAVYHILTLFKVGSGNKLRC